MPEVGTKSWLDGFSLLDDLHFRSINEYKTCSKKYKCLLVCICLGLLSQNYLEILGSSPIWRARGGVLNIRKKPSIASVHSDTLTGAPYRPSLCCPVKNYFSTHPILESFSLMNDRHASEQRQTKQLPGSV